MPGGLLYDPITRAAFEAIGRPKRICFGSTHRTALKKPEGSGHGAFHVPFAETIQCVFPWKLFKSKSLYGGYYRQIKSADEFGRIESWIADNCDLVFIKSLFRTAIAACEHVDEHEHLSRIGGLERRAKYQQDVAAGQELVGVLLAIFQRFHRDFGLQGVVSVPPSQPGVLSLPGRLAASLAGKTGLPDLTSALRWKGRKESLKAMEVAAKWGALERVGLTVDHAVAGKHLLLIDDMYQSGTTVHFVASYLRAAGARDLHLLSVSKSRRDTDNT